MRGTGDHPGPPPRLPAPGLRPQTTHGAGRPDPVQQGGLDGQGQEYGEDGGPAHRPVPRPGGPTPRCRAHRHGRHPEPGRDPLPHAFIELGMNPKEPSGKLHPAPLGPAAPGIVPWAVRRPTHAPGRVYGTSKECRLPHGLSRLAIQEQLPGRAVRRHGLAPVRKMTWWVQRVAPLRVNRAAHHRQRKTRPRLARTIVIHEQRTRFRPSGEDAVRRKYRAKNPLLVCLIRRRDK